MYLWFHELITCTKIKILLINETKGKDGLFYLLGIDDTDSVETFQTTDLTFNLGRHLEEQGLAKMIHLSCHHLYCDGIPDENTPTSTASCLTLEANPGNQRELDLVCREVLLRDSAPGSNAGYVLASWQQFDHEIVLWGKSAKTKCLKRQDALQIARRCGLGAAGILGSGIGVIGALAAVGLRFDGNDGWIYWMPGLHDLKGIYTQVQLTQFIHFDKIESQRHSHPAFDDRILFDKPAKPLLVEGKVLLPVKAVRNNEEYHWMA